MVSECNGIRLFRSRLTLRCQMDLLRNCYRLRPCRYMFGRRCSSTGQWLKLLLGGN